MDAYLTCSETKFIWLGKPIRSDGGTVVFYSHSAYHYNHEDSLLKQSSLEIPCRARS